MSKNTKSQFSEPVTTFQERRLPEKAIPIGYAALISHYDLSVPLPNTLSAIGPRHKIYEAEGWRIYTPRHMPEKTIEGQLLFALKYEGLNLVVLKHLFLAIPGKEIENIIKSKPTSSYFRRIWFLYEWLLQKKLNIPDIKKGNYVDIVNTKQQWAVTGEKVSRQRVNNNLPGTREFCPLVFRTPRLEEFIGKALAQRAKEVISHVSADILARTAAFLLLKDSKSSFAIEGEAPPQNRIQRWSRAVKEAGKQKLDLDELLRLQKIVIGDGRFIKLGLREGGGFIGIHDRDTRLPIPDHISASPQDLESLVQGLLDFEAHYASDFDAVIASTVLAFGFVYIHPFADGNGRLHRYLIHHILALGGFNPPGVVFPVSAAILERIDEYRRVLEGYSNEILPFIKWEPTKDMNVHVLNDTADFYRFFDATPHAEFLYSCVEKTIEIDLPEEADFLRRYDQFRERIEARIEMPASMIDLMFNFLKQNNGTLSKRALSKEFAALTKKEVSYIETVYGDMF